MTQYFFLVCSSWHHVGLTYWNRRFHPPQSHGDFLSPKSIRSPSPQSHSEILHMWRKIGCSASPRRHTHSESPCTLKLLFKIKAIKVCESSTQRASPEAHTTPCSFPDASPSQIMEAVDILLGKGLSDSTGS